MTPLVRMPDARARRRQAAVADVGQAMAAARCAARLAGLGTDEPLVRELLLTVIDQLGRAARDLDQLG